jgi:hypothetical protein
MPQHGCRSLDVHVNDVAEVSGGDLPERGIGINRGGIVEQQIRGAVLPDDLLTELRHLVLAADVGPVKKMGRTIGLAEFRDRLLTAAAARNGPAEGDKLRDHGASQTAADPGDADLLCLFHNAE